MSASSFNFIQIGSSNRSDDVLRADVWRTVNSVGRCQIVLRNTGGQYNNTFDVQDTVTISVQPPGGVATVIFRGRVDGEPAVELKAIDNESTWDEYVIVYGYDRAQDLLFHNDYEADYSDSGQQIKTILEDLFDPPKAITTNILYTTPAGGTPVVGTLQFREGTSFIGTLQEAVRKADWLFYVDDALNLRAGAPGFSATAEILTNTGAGRNIIDQVDLTKRDGGKLYNYIKLIGKNPMFDAYTEQVSSFWSSPPTTTLEDNTNRVMVGAYSQRLYNNAVPNAFLTHTLTCPVFDYDSWDFTKGEIGFWGYYDNQAGGGGTPGAGGLGANSQVVCRLKDAAGSFVDYYGTSSTLYRGEWGWCSFPLGEPTENTGITAADKWWYFFRAGAFDWEHVEEMSFRLPRIGVTFPSNFFIDGLTLPVPAIIVEEDAASQAAYRKRPLVLPMPHLQWQHQLDDQAEQLLAHHKDTDVEYLKLVVEGNVNLHYAGQSYTVNIPELNLNNAIFYATEIHHAVEPRVDLSDGHGFDYVTEIYGCLIGGTAYDNSRLDARQVYSPTQTGLQVGAGVRVK